MPEHIPTCTFPTDTETLAEEQKLACPAGQTTPRPAGNIAPSEACFHLLKNQIPFTLSLQIPPSAHCRLHCSFTRSLFRQPHDWDRPAFRVLP